MSSSTFLRRLFPAIGLIALVLMPACDKDSSTQPGGGSSGALTFMRADSTYVDLSSATHLYVWCGDWEHEEVTVPALHIWMGSFTQGQPYWYLRAVVSDVVVGEPLAFPNNFIWDQPDSVHIFLLDQPNELATDTEMASGTITFHQFPCPSGSTVDFTIDAVLGSEFGGSPSVEAMGRFTTEKTGPPPWAE